MSDVALRFYYTRPDGVIDAFMPPYERICKVLRDIPDSVLHRLLNAGTASDRIVSSDGERSVFAGPFTTFPRALNREP